MKIHEGYENLDIVRPVVTLGIFDGVHIGHKVLLDRLVSCARDANGEAVVITFSPHPRLVLDKDGPSMTFLTTLEEKIVHLGRAKVDHLIIMEFNKAFSRISACDFVNDILIGKIGTKHLIIGYDHHFGRSGEGDFDTIKKCTELTDFRVDRVEGVLAGEGAVSSSLIRDALLQGRIEVAYRLLGYSYSLNGTVIEGRRIGHSIGFPTANIRPDDRHKLIPSNGVYAVEVNLGDIIHKGMLSIGSNPTVNRDASYRSIEVHIIDFDKDIYGRPISVIFKKRLRDEIRFENIKKLTDQMEIDKQSTIQLLS